MPRTLSKGAQAARNAGYGTLKNFRAVSNTQFYKMLAGQYARQTGLKNKRAPLSPTSKFAKLYGKTYLTADGKVRAKPNRTYEKKLEKQTSLNANKLAAMEEY